MSVLWHRDMEFSSLAVPARADFHPSMSVITQTLYKPVPCGRNSTKVINIVAHVATDTAPILIAFTIIATPR